MTRMRMIVKIAVVKRTSYRNAKKFYYRYREKREFIDLINTQFEQYVATAETMRRIILDNADQIAIQIRDEYRTRISVEYIKKIIIELFQDNIIILIPTHNSTKTTVISYVMSFLKKNKKVIRLTRGVYIVSPP